MKWAIICFSWALVKGFAFDLKLDSDIIRELDEAMYEDVTKPTPIKTKVIMENMMKLFLSLDQIFDKLQEGGKIYDELKAVVDDIKAKGGLKILDIKQDNSKLMKAYDWDEDRTTQLKRNLERACEMWRNIIELLETTTSPP